MFSFLILVLTVIIAWHQILRTPQSGIEVSYRLRNAETDEPFEITKFETFEDILEPNEIGDGGSIPSGANTRTRAEINIRRMELFPRELEVRIQYSITVRDTRGTHELLTAHEFQIRNRMAKQ